MLKNKIDKNTLLIDLQNHLNSLTGKKQPWDEKTKHKVNVLEAALQAVSTGEQRILKKAIGANKRYSESFFASNTEKLVKDAFKVTRMALVEKEQVAEDKDIEKMGIPRVKF